MEDATYGDQDGTSHLRASCSTHAQLPRVRRAGLAGSAVRICAACTGMHEHGVLGNRPVRLLGQPELLDDAHQLHQHVVRMTLTGNQLP